MDERKLYTNTFNTTATNDRFFRWLALGSFIVFSGLLALYLGQ